MAFCKGTICQVAVLRQHIWSTLDRMHARRGVTPVKFFLALFFSIALLSFLFPDIFPNLSLGDERFFSGGRSNGPGDPERSAGSWTPQLDHTEGRTNHTRTLGGLLKTDFSGQHPLLELVAEAERKWNATAKRFVIFFSDCVGYLQLIRIAVHCSSIFIFSSPSSIS